jgi:hypothetical protein
LGEFQAEIKRYEALAGFLTIIWDRGLESFQKKANFRELLLDMAKA